MTLRLALRYYTITIRDYKFRRIIQTHDHANNRQIQVDIQETTECELLVLYFIVNFQEGLDWSN